MLATFIYSVLTGIRVSERGCIPRPFLEIFNERIEFDGNYICDEDLSVYTDEFLLAVKADDRRRAAVTDRI